MNLFRIQCVQRSGAASDESSTLRRKRRRDPQEALRIDCASWRPFGFAMATALNGIAETGGLEVMQNVSIVCTPKKVDRAYQTA